ncbi:MAG: hypothetical protein AAFV88_14705 [Planctomycetota bacterium]
MQLDQTHVAVRVRTLTELGDLALVVLNRYPLPILITFALGALPWLICNAVLLSWIPIEEARFGLDDSEAVWQLLRYVCAMSLLVFLQAPAAGVITTIFLGQAVFEETPNWRSACTVAREQFGRWFYCLAIRRLVLPTMILYGVRWFQPYNNFLDITLPLLIMLLAMVIRANRPFLPEMILLERCPMRSKNENEITLARRSRALHRVAGGDINGRWLGVALILVVLFGGFFYSLIWLTGITTGYWYPGLLAFLVWFPLALWMVAGLSVVVRMVSYLDARIRMEGWDVELAVRAEVIRQFGDETLSMMPAASDSAPGPATPASATPASAAGGSL